MKTLRARTACTTTARDLHVRLRLTLTAAMSSLLVATCSVDRSEGTALPCTLPTGTSQGAKKRDTLAAAASNTKMRLPRSTTRRSRTVWTTKADTPRVTPTRGMPTTLSLTRGAKRTMSRTQTALPTPTLELQAVPTRQCADRTKTP